MAVNRNKVLVVEINGTELDAQTELDLSVSESLVRLGGVVHSSFEHTVSASTLQLTDQSNAAHYFNGTTPGQIVKLPDATTLSQGRSFEFWNYSNQILLIQDFSGNEIAELRANGRTFVMLRAIENANGPWASTYTLDNGNVFGNLLFYSEQNAETSNNSNVTYANKITLVTPSLPVGDYLTQFQFNWRADNNSRTLQFRIQRNGIDVDVGEPFTGSVAGKQLISGFRRNPNLSGVQTLTLDFRRGANNTTVYMYNARLFIWRIS